MHLVVRWLAVPLATAAVVLLIAQISAQFSSTNVEVQLAVTARIDEQDRLEFGVIPPGGASADRILPRAPLPRLGSGSGCDRLAKQLTRKSSAFCPQSGDTLVVRVVARATDVRNGRIRPPAADRRRYLG